MIAAEIKRTKSLERRHVEDRDRNNDERPEYAYKWWHWLRVSLMFLVFYPFAMFVCIAVPVIAANRRGGKALVDDFMGTYLPWSFFIAAALSALAVILIDRTMIPRLVERLSSHWLRFSLLFLIFYPFAWVLCLFFPLLVLIKIGRRDLVNDFEPWSFFIAVVLNALAVFLIDRTTIPRLVERLSSQTTETMNEPEAPGAWTASNQKELALRVRGLLIGLVLIFAGLIGFFLFGRTFVGPLIALCGLVMACGALFAPRGRL